MQHQLSSELPPCRWHDGLSSLEFGKQSFRFMHDSDVTLVKKSGFYELRHKYWCVEITTESAKYLRDKYDFEVDMSGYSNVDDDWLTEISGGGISVYYDNEHKPLLMKPSKTRFGLDNKFYSLFVSPRTASLLKNEFEINFL